jgi:aerobic carbon-monoxide dehydrogenase medium subunit
MTIQAFDYIAPDSLEGIFENMQGATSQLLVGDQSYVSLLKRGYSVPGGLLISLKNVPELAQIESGGGYVSLGVTTTFADLKKHESLSALTALQGALATIKDPHLLNNSTIGGALYHCQAHHSPIAGALMALKAEINVRGPRTSRTVTIEEFFQNGKASGLLSGEIIRSVRLAVAGIPASSYQDISVHNRVSPLCGLATSITRKGKVIESVRLVLTGCVDVPVRLAKTESQLVERSLDTIQIDYNIIDSEPISLAGDLHTQTSYLNHLINVLLKKTLVPS